MKIIACIPARFGSTRLYGKPLYIINNKTIIQHVYEAVCKVDIIDYVVVLTDNLMIKNNIELIGGNVEMILEPCLNGTERICHYLSTIDYTNNIIINVQGDEPFISVDNIKKSINNYIERIKVDSLCVCSTLFYKTRNMNEIGNNSRGKLVLDCLNNIMYCSRNIIPAGKQVKIIENYDYKIHIGVFVFNATYLMEHNRNNNTELQLCEDIEWMKIIEQGYHINAVETTEHEIGVDTIEDYNYLHSKYRLY